MNAKLALEIGKWSLGVFVGGVLIKASIPALKNAVGLNKGIAPEEDIPEEEVDPSIDGEDFKEA